MFSLEVDEITINDQQIIRGIETGKRNILDQFGKDLTQIARSSMDRVSEDSTRISSPGQPPLKRSAEPNLSTIRHEVSSDLSSVDAGPIKTSDSPSGYANASPGIIERGGVAFRRVRRKSSRARATRKTVRIRYKAHPYIFPAGLKAVGRLRSNVSLRGIVR